MARAEIGGASQPEETSKQRPRRTGRPPQSAAERRSLRLRVARVAVTLFAARGVTATTGEAIAGEVGISSRTLWRHFPTKESCVRPLLDAGLEAAAEAFRAWPEDVSLMDFVRTSHQSTLIPSPDDDVLALLRLIRDEPALRSVWLEVHADAVPVFAEILARRSGGPADSLEVVVHAAMINGALRAAVEHFVRTAGAQDRAEHLARTLDAALVAVTRGLPY